MAIATRCTLPKTSAPFKPLVGVATLNIGMSHSPCHTLLLSPCPLPAVALCAVPHAPKYSSSSDCDAMVTKQQQPRCDGDSGNCDTNTLAPAAARTATRRDGTFIPAVFDTVASLIAHSQPRTHHRTCVGIITSFRCSPTHDGSRQLQFTVLLGGARNHSPSTSRLARVAAQPYVFVPITPHSTTTNGWMT